ncbi:MAG: hypothetical protein CFE21_09385 [Bacteroidetes bacterium B1(2017)]|nr:MAG: hypothetical protein CFE21_09385 [Bacteroidetes bacterium B1(2017)]
MKTLLSILACFLCQTTFAQFGIIADQDGYVNVRKSPTSSAAIIDTLGNGQIVFCIKKEGVWYTTDYHLNPIKNKSGFIHTSRVKLIPDFEKIQSEKQTDTSITFKKDSIKLTITRRKFNPKGNKLFYYKSSPKENEIPWIVKINGKHFWGTDGDIPKYQYGQMRLSIGNEIINLPTENLFEPTIFFTKVYRDAKKNTIYIVASNSDGAGAYEVLWIIENGAFKQQIITIPF